MTLYRFQISHTLYRYISNDTCIYPYRFESELFKIAHERRYISQLPWLIVVDMRLHFAEKYTTNDNSECLITHTRQRRGTGFSGHGRSIPSALECPQRVQFDTDVGMSMALKGSQISKPQCRLTAEVRLLTHSRRLKY